MLRGLAICTATLATATAAAFSGINKLRLLHELERLRGEGRTILFSTHDPDHALAHADRALLLANGATLVLAAVADALTDETLTKMYGVSVRVTEVEGVRRVFPVRH